MLKSGCVENVDLFDINLGLEFRYRFTILKCKGIGLKPSDSRPLYFSAETPFFISRCSSKTSWSSPLIAAGKTSGIVQARF